MKGTAAAARRSGTRLASGLRFDGVEREAEDRRACRGRLFSKSTNSIRPVDGNAMETLSASPTLQ
jgi:hypothetical protein